MANDLSVPIIGATRARLAKERRSLRCGRPCRNRGADNVGCLGQLVFRRTMQLPARIGRPGQRVSPGSSFEVGEAQPMGRFLGVIIELVTQCLVLAQGPYLSLCRKCRQRDSQAQSTGGCYVAKIGVHGISPLFRAIRPVFSNVQVKITLIRPGSHMK